MDLAPPALATRFQRENRVIRDWVWKVVGRAALTDVARRSSRPRIILHNRIKVVRPEWLESLPPRRWTSLQLVRVDNAEFVKDERKEHRWKVRFSCSGGPEYTLSLTDPVATERLNGGGTLSRRCVLTVSLTEPIAFQHTPPLCYKVAAAVIELPGTTGSDEPPVMSAAGERAPDSVNHFPRSAVLTRTRFPAPLFSPPAAVAAD